MSLYENVIGVESAILISFLVRYVTNKFIIY